MEENNLKHIKGKKIRRQYFNFPLIVLYSLMLAIPYFIFIISLCTGSFKSYDLPSTLWTSILLCFFFSLPLLILRTLNKYCFGRIICVLNEEGIYYSTKGKLRWETVERIEYITDSKPRFKNDTGKAFRVIVYTQGGKHIVLNNVPLYIVSRIKKYRKEIDVKILGATALVPGMLALSAIVLLCPFYMALLYNSPGISNSYLIIFAVIFCVLGIVRIPIFDKYNLRYRFWSRILPRKWLAYVILGCYYSSFFIVLLVLTYFPNIIVVCLLGIYMGVFLPPIPSGYSKNYLQSYDQLYETYVTKGNFWEKRIEKNKAKRTKK